MRRSVAGACNESSASVDMCLTFLPPGLGYALQSKPPGNASCVHSLLTGTDEPTSCECRNSIPRRT
eukprot:5775196-Pleurochrysis_carterae.AAC.3